MKAFGEMYYVVNRVLDAEEELAPFSLGEISCISKPSCIDQVKLRWIGYGNEGRGRWQEDKNGDVTACKITIPGHREIWVDCTLDCLDNHLHKTYEQALLEKRLREKKD